MAGNICHVNAHTTLFHIYLCALIAENLYIKSIVTLWLGLLFLRGQYACIIAYMVNVNMFLHCLILNIIMVYKLVINFYNISLDVGSTLLYSFIDISLIYNQSVLELSFS